MILVRKVLHLSDHAVGQLTGIAQNAQSRNRSVAGAFLAGSRRAAPGRNREGVTTKKFVTTARVNQIYEPGVTVDSTSPSDHANRVNGGSFSFLERMEGAMAQVCYSIKRDSIGWVISASGDAVLICKEKRIAINTARYAGRLLFVDGGLSGHDTEPRVCLTERRGARGAPAIAATGMRIAQ
jgi:hypothetical protein